MADTRLENLVNPQVLAAFLDTNYGDKIVFAPVADVDTTLESRPGSILSFPVFSYIGAASAYGEGSAITYESLQASTASVEVKKLAKGVGITDEAVLSGAGDPVSEIGEQLVHACNDATDAEFLTVLGSIAAGMTYTTANASTEVTPAAIADALELFGENIDGTKVVFVSPQLYTAIRKTTDWLPASEISAESLVKGAVGEIYGCQIIVTNRLKAQTGNGTAYIVKPGALRLVRKRGILVEADRTIGVKTDFCATVHMAAYLYDASKAIKIVKHA